MGYNIDQTTYFLYGYLEGGSVIKILCLVTIYIEKHNLNG